MRLIWHGLEVFTMEANLQIIGLIFDAAGIVVLVAPALIGMVGQIAAQSGTYWG